MTPRERIVAVLVVDLLLWLYAFWWTTTALGFGALILLYASLLTLGAGYWFARFRAIGQRAP